MSFMLVLAGCGNSASSSSSGGAKAVQSLSASDKDLRISVLNVGQADATLIQYKGKNMLIDTGEVERGFCCCGAVYDRFRRKKIRKYRNRTSG